MTDMRAWLSNTATHTVELTTVPVTVHEPGELLVRVLACGACRMGMPFSGSHAISTSSPR